MPGKNFREAVNQKDTLKLQWQKVPAIIKDWQPKEVIEASLKKELKINFSKMKDPSFGDRFFDYYYVENSDPKDYRYMVLKLSEGREIMTGIRFYGLDKNKAYVEIVYTNFIDLDEAILKEIVAVIKERYAVFNPFACRILHANDLKKAFPSLKIKKDLHFYTGKKSSIMQMDIPIKYDQIELVKPDNLDFYSLYMGMLEFYIEDNPGSEEYVFTLDKDRLNKLKEMGTLFCTYIDEQWAGIIACDYLQMKYLEGYCIVEECLINKFRGKHFAAAIQRKMIEMLPGDMHTLVYGEIHDRNIPSRKTASKNGRITTGTNYFILI